MHEYVKNRMRAVGFVSIITLVILVSGTLGFLVGAPDVFAGNKITICHVPPGNSDNKQTIEVSEKAVDAHLAHGDRLGPCNTEVTCNCALAVLSTPLCASLPPCDDSQAMRALCNDSCIAANLGLPISGSCTQTACL